MILAYCFVLVLFLRRIYALFLLTLLHINLQICWHVCAFFDVIFLRVSDPFWPKEGCICLLLECNVSLKAFMGFSFLQKLTLSNYFHFLLTKYIQFCLMFVSGNLTSRSRSVSAIGTHFLLQLSFYIFLISLLDGNLSANLLH